MDNAVKSKAIAIVYGPAGTGKTFALEALALDPTYQAVYLRINGMRISRGGFLSSLARKLRLPIIGNGNRSRVGG